MVPWWKIGRQLTSWIVPICWFVWSMFARLMVAPPQVNVARIMARRPWRSRFHEVATHEPLLTTLLEPSPSLKDSTVGGGAAGLLVHSQAANDTERGSEGLRRNTRRKWF